MKWMFGVIILTFSPPCFPLSPPVTPAGGVGEEDGGGTHSYRYQLGFKVSDAAQGQFGVTADVTVEVRSLKPSEVTDATPLTLEATPYEVVREQVRGKEEEEKERCMEGREGAGRRRRKEESETVKRRRGRL